MTEALSGLTQQTVCFAQSEELYSSLPNEIILKILSLLDIRSLAAASMSCKKMHLLSKNESFWKSLCIRDFFHGQSIDTLADLKTIYQDWKSLYLGGLEINLAIPFPGEQGIFRLDPNENWELRDLSNGKLRWFQLPNEPGVFLIDKNDIKFDKFRKKETVREFRFINEKKDALFREFYLLGYEDGKLEILILFPEHKREPLKVYLHSLDPSGKLLHPLFQSTTPDSKQPCCYMFVQGLTLMKTFFRIVTTFNTFPKEEHDLMRKIIWSRNWKSLPKL